ncbi:MAG TPA: TlyA family RNA methyltransferase [Thermoanaerobacterales bacterium]|nr:TlyA family RNA methyltransferase [Thermoanaerobacterales bacterium]
MNSKKQRLDCLLVTRGLYESREKAKRAIMSGLILVDKKLVDKPGTEVDIESAIEIKGDSCPYVSRGGLKLEKALNVFNINVKNKVIIDVGASTGGFTHCLLNFGAKKVYAIDVGYGQLDWKLRNDPRVVAIERKNIRYINLDDIGEKCDIATIDVSFISLKKVIPAVIKLLIEQGEIIALIKPQFETERQKVGKKGVVKSPNTHYEVVNSIIQFCEENDISFNDITYSPIIGPKGNIEYLIHLIKSNTNFTGINKDKIIKETIKIAHENLIKK